MTTMMLTFLMFPLVIQVEDAQDDETPVVIKVKDRDDGEIFDKDGNDLWECAPKGIRDCSEEPAVTEEENGEEEEVVYDKDGDELWACYPKGPRHCS